MSINFLKQVINFIQGDESKQEKKFKRAEYKDFQIKVKAFNEFINFEATRANGTKIRRNIYNLDIFADGGKSNPTFSCILFQKKLNIALKNKNLATITEDGYVGTNTAKAIQRLINAYLPEGQKLTVNGKIVSNIDTSKKTALVLDKMIVDNEPFVFELLEFIKNHGHIQQQGVFPIAKNSEGNPYFGV